VLKPCPGPGGQGGGSPTPWLFQSRHAHLIAACESKTPQATTVLRFLDIGQPNQRRPDAHPCSAEDSGVFCARLVRNRVRVGVALLRTLRLTARLTPCYRHVRRNDRQIGARASVCSGNPATPNELIARETLGQVPSHVRLQRSYENPTPASSTRKVS
jgi:hypothetical protein